MEIGHGIELCGRREKNLVSEAQQMIETAKISCNDFNIEARFIMRIYKCDFHNEYHLLSFYYNGSLLRRPV
jgi:hypothetical protein